MLTLSFGFLKPQTGDKGSIWFPAIESDIQQLNDHTHDGINSTKLTAQAIIGIAGTILAAGWVATSGGTYRQLVTMPPSTAFSNYAISFRNSANGFELTLSVEKVSASTYYVYINDNTLNLDVLYTA